MDHELLDLYRRASDWTAAKLPGAAAKLDAPTNCDGWTVRALLSHMLDTQRYFAGVARGEDVSPPSPTPPQLEGDDPVQAFDRGRGPKCCARSDGSRGDREDRPAVGDRVQRPSCCTHGIWPCPPARTQRCRKDCPRRPTR